MSHVDTSARVALVGAGGAVGAVVARVLADMGLGPLRLGARTPERLRPLLAELDGAEALPVDVYQSEQLADFCAGCRVVVNCVGPMFRVRTRVAAAAVAAGADYVDPGGDPTLRERMVQVGIPEPRVVIVGAGVMPGLSALVPRWLVARAPAPPRILTGYVATMDRITSGTATDFLLSLIDGSGEANAAWRAGARVSRALEPLRETDLPFFPGTVTAVPYLSTESERLARILDLPEVRWYHVFEAGSQILPTLSRLRRDLTSGAGLRRLAEELARSVDVEMLGRRPSQQLVFQLDGGAADRPTSQVAVLRASSTYELTASVTALAVRDTVRGLVAPGAHCAAEVLDPDVVDALPDLPGVVELSVLDGPLSAFREVEEGAV